MHSGPPTQPTLLRSGLKDHNLRSEIVSHPKRRKIMQLKPSAEHKLCQARWLIAPSLPPPPLLCAAQIAVDNLASAAVQNPGHCKTAVCLITLPKRNPLQLQHGGHIGAALPPGGLASAPPTCASPAAAAAGQRAPIPGPLGARRTDPNGGRPLYQVNSTTC